jgi:hypothetical protein
MSAVMGDSLKEVPGPRFRRFLFTPARVARKTRRLTAMHRRVVRERPAAELRALVVGQGLCDLGLCVHHKGAVLHHRLADRLALQQQELGFFAAVLASSTAASARSSMAACH